MTKNFKLGLLTTLVAFAVTGNCTSIGHGVSMKSELNISSDKHNSMQRPLEVTHEIQDKDITGKAEGMIFWLPGIFDASLSVVDTIGGVLGGVLRGASGAVASIPYVGAKAEGGLASAAANVGNIGPLLNNGKVLALANEAEAKAIYENNIDGFYRTGVHASIETLTADSWFIFKLYRVEVTGKPIVIKTLGTVSPERLAKIQNMAAKASCKTCDDIKKAGN